MSTPKDSTFYRSPTGECITINVGDVVTLDCGNYHYTVASLAEKTCFDQVYTEAIIDCGKPVNGLRPMPSMTVDVRRLRRVS